MPRSKGRKALDLPTYLHDRLASEADRRKLTTAGLAAEYVTEGLMNAATSTVAQTFACVVAGEIEPLTDYPTTGETFYYHQGRMPLVDVGRLPGHTGIHVLRRPDGRLVWTGGYHLTREQGAWQDFLSAMSEIEEETE